MFFLFCIYFYYKIIDNIYMKIMKVIIKPFIVIKKAIKRIYRFCFIKPQFISCGRKTFIGDNLIGTLSNIEIGNNSVIGPNCVFYCSLAKLTIGNYVMISPNVTIITGSHKTDAIGKYMIQNTEQDKINDGVEKYDMPVIIEDDVWIGANVLILKGVTIGRGSIVHAGQVITKSVPPYTIYINDKLSIKRFSRDEIEKHEKLLAETKNGKTKKH